MEFYSVSSSVILGFELCLTIQSNRKHQAMYIYVLRSNILYRLSNKERRTMNQLLKLMYMYYLHL